MLYFDEETYNEVPIGHGTYKYASTCEPLVITYAFDDQPVQVWDYTLNKQIPGDLEYALHDGDELITAHSSMFDRNVLYYAHGISVPIHRWRDTMVKALSHSLPGGLDKLCDILKVPYELAKQKTGRQLINLFCKPRGAHVKIRRATHETHPKEWQDFIAYAVNDTEAMRYIDKKLPNWNYQGFELALWHLDQLINDRGFAVDVALAEAAICSVEKAKAILACRGSEITGGAVPSTTQRDVLLGYILQEYGVGLPDMQMATLERRIADPDLPIELRELLGIRLQATTTSTSKYKSLLKGVMADGRLRGTLQFNGANRTGRWSGRGFQPQNLPRPDMTTAEINEGIDAMEGGYVDLIADNVMRVASNAIRGCIIAPPKRKLVVADLSNIEGRSAAWVAGERWKLKAFADYDVGVGPDLYVLAYAKSFRVDPATVTKTQRQIGKVKELMLAYGGGVGAYVTGAATYGVDLDAMAENSIDVLIATEPEVWQEAKEFWNWTNERKRSTFGLDMETFMVCDSFKRLWRRNHPCVVQIWQDLEDYVMLAIANPGTTYLCGMLKIRKDGAWLRIQLPSGRSLCYPSAQVIDKKITYMGVNQYSHQWRRIGSYGGKLFENICQAVARDVLAANMPAIDAAGYKILFTSHDEPITETPDTEEFTADRLSALLSATPAWAQGMPLAAGGFETMRYRKE